MRQYRFETSMEDMISRVPGMFAYLEFNEDWTTTLHPATDSYVGSWGKVVENISLPCGTSLCSYVQLDNEPENYTWTEEDTYPYDSDMDMNYSVYSSEYARRVEYYWYSEIEYESGKSYVEVDTLPTEVTEESPQYIKVLQKNSDGEYMVDCQGNKLGFCYEKITEYSYYKKDCMLVEGETYTYKTLTEYYYRFKDKFGDDDPFISFMNRGFGKIDVDKKSLNLDNSEEYPDVPDYIYLSNVSALIEKYKGYKRTCEFYESHYTVFGEYNENLDRKCKAYNAMGGDRFLSYLIRMSDKANAIASEYLCYAENRSYDLNISLNVPLFQSKNDLGYLSCYINEFIPGEHYQHGELLTYEGRTYICLLNRFIPDGNNYPYVLCGNVLYKRGFDTYQKIDVSELTLSYLPSTPYNGMSCVLYNGEYYIWNQVSYEKIDVTTYCTGFWNEDKEENEFDTQHFVLLSEYVGNEPETLGIPLKDSLPDSDKWYSDENFNGTSFRIYLALPYLPHSYIYPHIKCGETFMVWDNELLMYVVDPDSSSKYTIIGTADSQLKNLRSYSQYMNGNDYIEEPTATEDWLYYYKVGNFNASGSILWDNVGNIRRFTDSMVSVGDYVNDLMAYGTVLTSISCDSEEKTLTFTYVVNGHLKARLAEVSVDNDGNEIFRYDTFEYDTDDSHGIVYTEKHPYNDPDIDELVSNGDFDAFVEGRKEYINNYMAKYGYKKFVFSTDAVLSSVNIGNYTYDTPSVVSEFSETVENEPDYIYQPLFKKDYFTGYAYEPNVDASVDIQRGNAASYERHIRLSESKTVEDISSSGFYAFSE